MGIAHSVQWIFAETYLCVTFTPITINSAIVLHSTNYYATLVWPVRQPFHFGTNRRITLFLCKSPPALYTILCCRSAAGLRVPDTARKTQAHTSALKS